jgi:hypothetical protein
MYALVYHPVKSAWSWERINHDAGKESWKTQKRTIHDAHRQKETMEPIVHRRTHLSASLLTSSGDMLSGILSSGEPMNSYRNISISEREREREKNQGMVYYPKTMLNLCVILHHVILVIPSKLNKLSIVAPFQHTHILWKSEKTYHRYPKKKELLTKRLDDHHHARDSVVVFDTNRVNEQPIATEDQSSQQETFASLKCRLSCLWTRIKEWNWNF